ncbi:hypothetical protein EB72_24880 [Mycobacterium sp. SWH-M1]|nr:hypothetical protein EB72_24880 [Mycobacterium sp. SWH-M1]
MRGSMPLLCAYVTAAVYRFRDDLTPAQWSTTVQLVGTAMTFAGLLWAYARASNLWARIKDRVRYLIHGPQGQVITPGAFHFEGAVGTPNVWAQLGFAPGLTVQEKFDRIEDFLNGYLRERVVAAEQAVVQLRDDLAAARTASEESANEALNHMRAELARLTEQANRTQVLDLRFAIFGLAVTGVGTCLSYWV